MRLNVLSPAWLQRYYPELLWPTKERRVRHRFRNREKVLSTNPSMPSAPLCRGDFAGAELCNMRQAPKTRFKVSQDGKGGRSANS